MCFGLQWIEQVLIWLVAICAVVALLRLLVLPRLGFGAEILSFLVQAVTILMWAIICIAAIIFIFDLIACLMPSLPRLTR